MIHDPERDDARPDDFPPDLRLDGARSACADLLSGMVFFVLGLAVVFASWSMPRLEERGVHPLTVPGLVPAMLGLALAALGALLAAKAWRTNDRQAGWHGLLAMLRGDQAVRFAATLGLVLIHTLVLVGWVPFWLASALFVFAFIVTFELVLPSAPASTRRSLVWGALIALVAGVGVVLLFERLFLVRLP